MGFVRGIVPRILAIAALWAASADAADLLVPEDHPTVQAAVVAAADGDRVLVGAGAFDGDVDFLGKAIVVVGTGAETVLRGSGTGPVVTFASGEGAGSVLDSVVVTGGSASAGGGVRIVDASPTVRRTIVMENVATERGSGIFVGGAAAAPFIHNNLVIYNAHTAGDPHAIQSDGASPRIVNNTVVRNDSNGIFLTGDGAPEVVNNLIAWNGSRVAGLGARGRGICDFTSASIVRHNLFHRNRVAALLRAGKDWRRIRRAERALGGPDFTGNVDGNPKLRRRKPRRRAAGAAFADFAPRPRSRAVGAGDPSVAHQNVDGSRNTIGHTGGPFGVQF